ncbi:MAG: hypothetical protein J5654_11305 [Victivallales bacterium]|nr:hypothetical protein [Victivallales bacterium]
MANAKTWDNDDPEPLYVTDGNLLEPEERDGEEYAFQYIDPNNVQYMQFPEGFNPNDVNALQSFLPQNANMVVCFSLLQDCLRFSVTSQQAQSGDYVPSLKDIDGSVVVHDPQMLKQASGFKSSRGTILPQLICPWNKCWNSIAPRPAAGQTAAESPAENGKFKWTPQRAMASSEESGFATMQYDSGTGAKMVPLSDRFGGASMITIPGVDITRFPTDADFHLIFDCGLTYLGAVGILADIVAEQEPQEPEEEEEEDPNNPTPPEEEKPREPAPPKIEVFFYNLGGGNPNGADYMHLTYPRNGNVTVQLNAASPANGMLDYPDNCLKTPHATGMVGEQAISFLYPQLNCMSLTGGIATNPEQKTTAISGLKNADFNFSDSSTPTVEKFPQEYREGKYTAITVGKPGDYPVFGSRCRVVFTNCWGNFGLATMRFSPYLNFSLFYWRTGDKASIGEYNIDASGSRADKAPAVQEVFTLAVGGDTKNYAGYDTPRAPKALFYDAENDRTLVRVDFSLKFLSGNLLSGYPIEVLGIIGIRHRSGRMNNTRNGDGNFANGFRGNLAGQKLSEYISGGKDLVSGTAWMNYITQVNITHNFGGASGQITLDKQMMMDIAKIPTHSIGALTLVAKNGFFRENGTTRAGGTHNYRGHEHYPNLPWGQIFRGYVTQVNTDASDGSGSITLTLAGINRKLDDMVWVNAPYWDGDKAFRRVLDYIVSYTGCDLRYVDAFSRGTKAGGKTINDRDDFKLNYGPNWESPGMHFSLGTKCLESLSTLADAVNHKFVIQPDGRGYFYGLGAAGIPVWVTNGPVVMEFDEAELERFDIEPNLDQRYNSLLTIGAVGDWQKRPDGSAPFADIPDRPVSFFTEFGAESDQFPWQRLLTHRVPGVLTRPQIKAEHQTAKSRAQAEYHSGTATIPGFHGFYMYDKIRIKGAAGGSNGRVFFITQIQHTLTMATKEWKTTLSLQRVEL